MQEARDEVVERIRSQLIGPFRGAEEVIEGKPFWRYMVGILFPSGTDVQQLGESDEPDVDPLSSDDGGTAESVVGLSYQDLPASMGVSFYAAEGSELVCEVEAAVYESSEQKGSWRRRSLGSRESPGVVRFAFPPIGERKIDRKPLFNGLAAVDVVFRPRETGHLVTATLMNPQRKKGEAASQQIPAMLFQCRMRVSLPGGAIGEYPTARRLSTHEEDEELALVYRGRKTLGIGHGCAAVWPANIDGSTVTEIVAEPIPAIEVRGMTNEIEMPDAAQPALELRWLCHESTTAALLRDALSAFIDSYEGWVKSQESVVKELASDLLAPAKRLLSRQREAVKRMRKGVQALTDGREPTLLRAFRIAQEAMLRQFLWTAKRTAPVSLGAGHVERVDPFASRPREDEPRWRPFQLAFQLLVLDSLADTESKDRQVLDLLWFPTGGGKTEAYLALTALEIVHRRLRFSDAGSGTAVLMRYTLRLLTSQQFERCTTLIASLEHMRRESPELGLGERPISIGLWVGGGTTPNALSSDSEKSPGAVQLFERLKAASRPDNPFQLLACPHCSTRIVPERQETDDHYGLHVSASSFRVFCPDSRCVLHEGIPVSVVDEDLYANPPSLLIGTIDKFARMVWEPSSRAFFGIGREERLPPTLIIQDELHLITGPLGTIAGVYEAALDAILKSRGITPKYVAATATIQRSREQCRAIYARDAFVFPPPGIDASDSFFSREDTESPGRKYIGVMGPGLYSGLTSLIQVSAAAADAVQVIDASALDPRGRKLRDAYWTQVIYHNSRQELGKTTTMIRDDVKTRLEILEPDEVQRRKFEDVEELSANLKGSEIAEALERLNVAWPNRRAIDALACTNMISVGVDIGRLGLMIVKGQPKSTAEYIQASSRVGRDGTRPPGIVIALHTGNRPRDRSHYESFQSFHQALYRGVEPASVTPFAPPALDRTLHAALVMSLRHCLRWAEPSDAGKFDRSTTADAISGLVERLLSACKSDERALVTESLDALITTWHAEAHARGESPLVFHSGGKAFRNLLRPFEERDTQSGIWPTLNSMRHVDGESRFDVLGE